MTKLLGTLTLFAMAVALTPKSALADEKEGVHIKASFTVAFIWSLRRKFTRDLINYCAGG